MLLLDWPERNGAKPVTTGTNQRIWRAASLEDPAFVSALDSCSNWRNDYPSIIESFVRLQLNDGAAHAIRMCQAGLDEAMQAFVLRNEDGLAVRSLAAAVQERISALHVPSECKLETESFVGTRTTPTTAAFRLASPHGTDADPLWITDPECAHAQLKAWEDYGCMETSATKASARVSQLPSAPTQDKLFVLLGVTSELGPARQIFRLPNTHVLGVSRKGSRQKELAQLFQEIAPPSSSLRLCSANLLSDFFEIADWILQEASTSEHSTKQLVVCSLVYMDGEANVRATLAMDSIVQIILAKHSNVALSYLTSPATVYTIPPAAARFAELLHEEQPWTKRLLFQPQMTWSQEPQGPTAPILYNGIVHLQGPNYCLAKTLQQWRCIVTAATDPSVTISAPHAPPSRTVSVTHNATAAAALNGQPWVAPALLPLDANVASALMTSILIHHLQEPPTMDKSNPFALFWNGAVHGGMWRCPFTMGSISVPSYLAGRLMGRPPTAVALGPWPRTEEEGSTIDNIV